MKVAILGTENSHALAFARLIKNDPAYRDVELVGIYGYDDDANRVILNEGLTKVSADRPDAFLGKADGILVTARHGDHHPEYAMPYVERGIPAFIDKPYAVSLEAADRLMNCAVAHNTLLCGGSSLKHLDEMLPLAAFAKESPVLGGSVMAPIHMVNPYGGFYFYAQHMTEILFTVFGNRVRAVDAYCPDETRDRVTVRFDYGDFDVAGLYYGQAFYSATVCTQNGTRFAEANNVEYCYRKELDEYFRMVKTGVMPQTHEELVKPLAVMHAIEQAWRTGKTAEIEK